jgi:hypothetical protein
MDVTLDRWSDLKKNSIINILVSSCKCTIFFYAIDISQPMILEYIYGHIKNAIEAMKHESTKFFFQFSHVAPLASIPRVVSQ